MPIEAGEHLLSARREQHSTVTAAQRQRGFCLRKRPGDDHPLDLGGAFVDVEHLRIPVPLLHRMVGEVAVPAEDLDGLFGDPRRHLGGLELRHRALGGLVVAVAPIQAARHASKRAASMSMAMSASSSAMGGCSRSGWPKVRRSQAYARAYS